MAVTGTDAALASDIVAQVSAPSSPMPGAFGSCPLGSLWWGSPEELFCDTWPGESRMELSAGELFLGGRSYINMALLLGSPTPSPASSELPPTGRGGGVQPPSPPG